MAVYLLTEAIAKDITQSRHCAVLILLVVLGLLELFEHLLCRPETIWVRQSNLLQVSRHILNSDPVETLLLGEFQHRVDESFFEIVHIVIDSAGSAHTDFFFLEVDVGSKSSLSVSVEH